MNTTEMLLEVRDLLDDPNKDSWSDAEIIRQGTRQLRSLWRSAVEINEGYGNCDVMVPFSAFNETFTRVYDYRMPRWVSRVIEVRARAAGSTSDEQSPWLIPDKEQLRGAILPQSHGDIRTSGWQFHEPNLFRMLRSALTEGVYIKVAKVPPPLGVFTLDLVGPSSTTLHLPESMTLGRIDNSPGVYRNALIEVTGTAQLDPIAHGVVGDIRRVVDSKSQQAIGLVRRTLITVDAAFSQTLAIGDTLDIYVPLPDEHTRVLVLKVVSALLKKHANKDIIAALRPEMAEEMAKFMMYIKPRQVQEPSYFRRPTTVGPEQTRDKDQSLNNAFLEGF